MRAVSFSNAAVSVDGDAIDYSYAPIG